MTTQLLTVAQVAEACQINPKTVERAIHRGELKASQLARRGAWRITPDDFAAWLEARANVTEPQPRARRAPQPARIDPPPAHGPSQRRRRGSPARGTLKVTRDMGRT